MAGSPSSSRVDLRGDDEGGGVGTEVIEEEGKGIHKHKQHLYVLVDGGRGCISDGRLSHKHCPPVCCSSLLLLLQLLLAFMCLSWCWQMAMIMNTMASPAKPKICKRFLPTWRRSSSHQ